MSTSEQNFQRKLFKMKRKSIQIKATKEQQTIKKTEDEKGRKEADELTKIALMEIERETQRSAARAEQVGASGWKPCPLKKTNKRFLNTTVRTVVNHNKRSIEKNQEKSQKKLKGLVKRQPKFGTRIHSFQSTEERFTKKCE